MNFKKDEVETSQSGDMKLAGSFQFYKLENFIVHSQKLLFTLISYVLILLIYLNLSVKSLVIGIVVFTLYLMINGIFLGHAFFNEEGAFFRLMFGVLLLIMLLGFVGWLIMIIHNLDAPKVILALIIVSTLSSMLNRRMKHKDVTQ